MRRPWVVPYARSKEGSHDYIDLAREPHRIDELPEAKDRKPLRKAMATINSSGKFFTVTSASWEVRDPNLRHEGLLEVALRHSNEDAFPRTLYLVFHTTGQRLFATSLPGLRFCFEMRPLHFTDSGRRTWGLTARFTALSADIEVGKQVTGEGLDMFVEVLHSIRQ
jgi:hypothetical protein